MIGPAILQALNDRFEGVPDEEILDSLAKGLRRELNTRVDYGFDANNNRYFFYAPDYNAYISFIAKSVGERRWDIIGRAAELFEMQISDSDTYKANRSKVFEIFKKADTQMSLDLQLKTDGMLDISGVEGVFVDYCMDKHGRHGFYCWGDFNGAEYGASYDDLGKLSSQDYADIIDLFREKYPNLAK